MTIRKVYSVLMICLLLFGIGYPITGAFAEEDKDDQFKITETEFTNENDEKIEEVDAEKQINAKFHLKMTGKQARENDSTTIALSGTDTLSLPAKKTEFAPEIAGVKADSPLVTFQTNDELNGYVLKWDKEEFADVADDQEIDYEVTLPLTIQTIAEDFKAEIEMKFSGLKENVKFGSLSFKAPVEAESTETEVKATEKESETSKQESQSSEKAESESDDDADADADKETESEENDSKDSKAVLESNPINNFTTEKDVSQVSIKQNAFSDKFDIWSKNKNDDAVTIVEGKTNSGGLTSFDDLEENYYSSYHTGAGQKSTVIMYDKGYGGITNDKISIYYDNVGEYTDASGVGTM